MGISIMRISGGEPCSAAIPTGNPKPTNFKVLRSVQYGLFWVSEVHYPDARNYEGHKVLVTNRRTDDLLYLDPHFSCTGQIVARFPPTDWGWQAACAFAEMTMPTSSHSPP